MTSTMQSAPAGTMLPGAMSGKGAGSAAGSGTQGMKQAGMVASAGHQSGQLSGNGSAPTAKQLSTTAATN